MPTRLEVTNYFRSIPHPNAKVRNCQRCGRLMNYERVTKEGEARLVKLSKIKQMPLFKWHKFKLCESCFQDKEAKAPATVDLEHLEQLNLTYRYLHKQL